MTKDKKVTQELQVLVVQQVTKDKRVIKDRLEQMVDLVLMDLMEQKVRKVRLDQILHLSHQVLYCYGLVQYLIYHLVGTYVMVQTELQT